MQPFFLFFDKCIFLQKVDSLLDSKIKALDVLDESNKAKNAIYGIDPTKSRTSEFINDLVSKKIQSATGSIGPLINGASTLFSGASAGFSNALVSKFAPLSSLSGGLSGGSGGAGTYKYDSFLICLYRRQYRYVKIWKKFSLSLSLSLKFLSSINI